MQISDVIKQLKEFKKEFGDIDVAVEHLDVMNMKICKDYRTKEPYVEIMNEDGEEGIDL